jgi:hypothetical protein
VLYAARAASAVTCQRALTRIAPHTARARGAGAGVAQVDAARRTVTLPKVVDWYSLDFSPRAGPGSAPDVARAVGALLPAGCAVRAQLEACLGPRGGGRAAVRYAAFEWVCHPRLRLWSGP